MPDVYVNGRVRVRAEQCDACLFSKNRLVEGRRALEIIRSTRAQPDDGASFVCHKGQVSEEPDSICRVWFDRYARDDAVLRLAIAMNIIEEV
jgi:hypothetical protein